MTQRETPGKRYWDAVVIKTRQWFADKTAISSQAFQQWLNPLKDHLYNFIYKSLGMVEDADDVYQDTILRAYKYRGSYNPDYSFKTWLFTIANNEIKAWYKHNQHHIGTGPLEDSLQIPATMDQEKEKIIRVIYDIALQLGEKQRHVFFLFYDHGFSLREIKTITGLKEGNIKFILNRCREAIKEKLNLEGVKVEK